MNISFNDANYEFNEFDKFNARSYHVAEWRRLGRAVRNSTLNSLDYHYEFSDGGEYDELLVAVPRCIGAFFNEVKHNKSIVYADLHLRWAWVNDLSEFIVTNKALKRLHLSSHEPVSLEQSTALSRAIGSARLLQVYN